MARPILGDEPLQTVVRFRVTDSERAMLAELCADGEISAFLRAYIRQQHRQMLRNRGTQPDSVEH